MKKKKKKESHNSNFSIDFPFPLSLSKGRRVYFNRSPIPIPPREVKIFFLSRDTSDESFISGARYVRYVRIEIRRTMKYPIRRGMAARFSILDFHPVIGSELSGAIITDRRDPWAVVNDQRRIFDSFRGGGARFTDGAAEHLPRGCNGKTVGCMHGCESVYIILEQIFCTRNDGARCVISTHLYLCHVIRLVILHIRSLGSGRARTSAGGGREKKAKRRTAVEAREEGRRRRVFGYEEI